MVRAREIGFLTSIKNGCQMSAEETANAGELTGNRSDCTASAFVVDDCSITLDSAVDGQIASISRVCDL